MGSHRYIYISRAEQEYHIAAIHLLGDSLGVPDETVKPVYESELERISAEARIRDFLPLLVSKLVKGVLLNRSRESSPGR